MSAFIKDGLARNFLAGNWVEGDGGNRIAVEDPGSAEHLAHCALAGEESLGKALEAARASFERGDLADMRPSDRAGLLWRIAAEIRKIADEGADLLCRESGKTLSAAHEEFEEAAQYFEYYGGVADKIEGKSIPLGPDYVDYTVYEPYGVSAQIVPWNFPVSIAARSLAPAMAAGNSVIIKSPELDPIGLAMLGVALERADVPKGAVSILNGIGRDIGAKLVASSEVDQIVFTGSVPTGQAILRAAAGPVTPSLMELGGKSAAVVLEDADIDTVIASLQSGIFYNAGQVCSAMSRVLVHRSIYEDVVERAAALANGLSVGHGLDNPEHTPVISAAQLKGIEEITSTARQSGARVAAGGSSLERQGYFMAPTILADVDPASRVAQEEIFGPVVCITPFDSDAEAIALANGTEFGLVAGVFTKDLARTHRIGRKLRAGQVFVNEWFAGGISTPFGGVGKSGFGREKGLEALYNYVRTKNIAISLKG
ncbi:MULTISPECIES: aldehyde dehydrogenase family protein [unclassified Pseudovibrio]|uniref:aldehyde dehydrogenase family protein n=1 Tax=unclassified Pseudovibrio TaxID=2627060 RepID=UPI0007AEB662|nr:MULTISPECIES: aldehyde dehydrogenase family protein [unclassified Pseudovibrio]KZK98044.1 Betaine aldehyde dehydrogenase [Pseudovibrio sp. W74]KZL05271.1 Betaine aldehyde dehydrogenase [Pseudovibrio sp. Ad14]